MCNRHLIGTQAIEVVECQTACVPGVVRDLTDGRKGGERHSETPTRIIGAGFLVGAVLEGELKSLLNHIGDVDGRALELLVRILSIYRIVMTAAVVATLHDGCHNRLQLRECVAGKVHVLESL